MRRTKKIILVVLLSILAVAAFNPTDFYSYKSYSAWAIFPNRLTKCDAKGVDSISNRGTQPDKKRDFAIIIHGLNGGIHDADTSTGVVNVFVKSSNSFGLLRFVPIFKLIKFRSTFSYRCTAKSNVSLSKISVPLSGSFEIIGTYKIFGICSPALAEKQIQTDINKAANERINDDLRSQLK